jgi:hypothetical protein
MNAALEHNYVLYKQNGLPGHKPSSAQFQRPSIVTGIPWRGPEPAGAQASRW